MRPSAVATVPRVLILSALACAPLITACGGEADAASRWAGTMRDSAGVTIVENQDVPLWREGDAWTFTKLVRIGVREGDPRYQFGSTTGLVVLSDGRVVVADGMSHNIRFFSPDGEYLHELGREGSGPGEFAGFINLLLGPGDTILAVDGRTAQASRISPDGEWLGSFSTLPAGGYWTWAWDDDETSRHIVTLLRPMAGDAAPEDVHTMLVVRRSLHGAFLDTVARLPALESATGTGDSQLQHRYRTGGYVDLCDGMVVTGNSDAMRFVWQRLDGSVERIVTLDRERMPFTGADRDMLLRRLDLIAERRGWSTADAAARKSRLRFEDQYPSWRRFVCGPAGSIMVQRVRRLTEFAVEDVGLADRPPGGDWEIFDREGRFLGIAPLPVEPHRHAFARGGDGTWLMVGQELDELEVPYVGVWRIEGVDRD
jgi:hypothetical protein